MKLHDTILDIVINELSKELTSGVIRDAVTNALDNIDLVDKVSSYIEDTLEDIVDEALEELLED